MYTCDEINDFCNKWISDAIKNEERWRMRWYFVANEGSGWLSFVLLWNKKVFLFFFLQNFHVSWWQRKNICIHFVTLMTDNESNEYQIKKKQQTKRSVLNFVGRHTSYNINSRSDWNTTNNITAATYKIWRSTWVASVKNFVSTHFSKYFILTSFLAVQFIYL